MLFIAKSAISLTSPQCLSSSAFSTSTLQNTYNSCRTRLKMYSSLVGKVFVSIDEGIQAAVRNGNTNNNNEQEGAAVFVDGSWWLGKVRDSRAEFEAGPRIVGAQFFDIDDIATKGNELNPKDLPHMAPPKVSVSISEQKNSSNWRCSTL